MALRRPLPPDFLTCELRGGRRLVVQLRQPDAAASAWVVEFKAASWWRGQRVALTHTPLLDLRLPDDQPAAAMRVRAYAVGAGNRASPWSPRQHAADVGVGPVAVRVT